MMNPEAGAEAVIEHLEEFDEADLADLTSATVEAILDGEGFGWLTPPPKGTLEAYWRGVLLIPERLLFVARLNGTIVGTAPLIKPPANNQAGAFAAELATFFIAPWARGHGLAHGLLAAVEEAALRQGFKSLDLSVRADREAAIALCEQHGFKRWGTKERYAMVKRRYVAGHYYAKHLEK